jgi:hypothetical protein
MDIDTHTDIYMNTYKCIYIKSETEAQHHFDLLSMLSNRLLLHISLSRIDTRDFILSFSHVDGFFIGAWMIPDSHFEPNNNGRIGRNDEGLDPIWIDTVHNVLGLSQILAGIRTLHDLHLSVGRGSTKETSLVGKVFAV